MNTIWKNNHWKEKVLDHVTEVRSMVDKKRYTGTVIGRDRAGTTLFIKFGDRTLLAFTEKNSKISPGDIATFWINQQRAEDCKFETPTLEEEDEQATNDI